MLDLGRHSGVFHVDQPCRCVPVCTGSSGKHLTEKNWMGNMDKAKLST